jgi:hypothetical protein
MRMMLFHTVSFAWLVGLMAGGVTQINFDIPIFEGHIDADVVENG